MKILDLPSGLGDCSVDFMPDTWQEFDQAVAWLLQNGVPLEFGYYPKQVVSMKGGMAMYLDSTQGKRVPLNRTLEGSGPSSVSAIEGYAEYSVVMPNHRR